jgi:Flp pilus assembly protein TadB
MTPAERGPTREELLAMAYADGELGPAERREFEQLLGTRADLRQELVRLKRLELLARQAAGSEPVDHEWAALGRDPLHAAGLRLGWTLLIAGGALGAAFALWSLWASGLPLALQLGATAALAGFALLVVTFARARRRTRRSDAFTEVRR